MLEPGLYGLLVSAAPTVEGRVHPVILPQGTPYPALTYQLVSDPRDHDLDGPTGLVEARYQISAWSPDYDDAKAASEAVRVALDGFSGTMGTVTVSRAMHLGAIDLFDQTALVHHVVTDYAILYTDE